MIAFNTIENKTTILEINNTKSFFVKTNMKIIHPIINFYFLMIHDAHDRILSINNMGLSPTDANAK